MANDDLWLEVSNLRTEGAKVEVQLKGDRSDKEPAWWVVPGADAKEIFRAFDSKRVVLAGLKAQDNQLVVHAIRIQLSDPGSR